MTQASTICAGIDAGSRAIKVLLWDPVQHAVVAARAVDQGVDQESLAMDLLDRLLAECGRTRADLRACEEMGTGSEPSTTSSGKSGRGEVPVPISSQALRALVATGYGRKLIGAADRAVTEITCQAWGVRQRQPATRTIIDIGGQDSKVLRLAADGSIDDFVMNDRCAAGSGRFLEVLAERLSVDLSELGRLARGSRKPALISSMCVVFAETEIVGLLASRVAPEDIVAGVQTSVARRIAAMVGPHPPAPIVLTGGVALIPGMDAALSDTLQAPVTVCPDPQFTGALGAAVLASQHKDGRHVPAI